MGVALLVLLAGAGGLAGCGGGAEGTTPAPLVAVQVATAARGALPQWVRSQAVLYPVRQAIITPKISAPVSRFYVQRGDRVHAGELLATLENRDLTASAEQARGQLEAAQANYQTAVAGDIPAALKTAQLNLTAAQKTLANAQTIYTNDQNLFRQGAIPRRTLDQAGVDLTNAQNAATLAQQHLQALESGGHAQALKAAQGQLTAAQGQAAAAAAQVAYSKITSPMDGVVTDRPSYPGELATPSAPLMTIMDLSQVVARAALPAAQAALLKVGDTATITPTGGRAVPAKVTVVSPATDAGSTTVEVWVTAPNPQRALRPGTTVEVAMLARTLPQALLVPSEAILTDAGGAPSGLVVRAAGKAHQTPDQVGVADPAQTQIVSGISAGTRVVTVGAYGLPDGAQIKIEAASKDASTAP
jgi:multidrug efflux pump subunit AcrA (membrane-fusion protein)